MQLHKPYDIIKHGHCRGGDRFHGPVVKRLRHRPFTAVTRVRFPSGSVDADVAQLAEQLICNQQVIGSSPIIGFLDGFPSGQRGQTVNLLQHASVVRIHLHPVASQMQIK